MEGVPIKIKKRRANGIIKGLYTLKEHVEWHNDTASNSKRISKNSLNTRNLNVKEATTHQSENDYFQTIFKALIIHQLTKYEDGSRLPSAVTYKLEVSKAQTFSVTTSVGPCAAIEFFSASMGLEVNESKSFTVTEGPKLTVGCELQGQIRFYSLYNYHGILSGFGQTCIDLWFSFLMATEGLMARSKLHVLVKDTVRSESGLGEMLGARAAIITCFT